MGSCTCELQRHALGIGRFIHSRVQRRLEDACAQKLEAEMILLEEDARLSLETTQAELHALEERFGIGVRKEELAPLQSLNPAQQAFLHGVLSD